MVMMAFSLVALSWPYKKNSSGIFYAECIGCFKINDCFFTSFTFYWMESSARVGFYGVSFDSRLLRREFLAWYFLWVVPLGIISKRKGLLMC